ncbi:MAG: hypothetical protein KGI78_02100 [Patescibacteria group bacterium]|nr:hypothetical protein [Patescibacteria group bacterium]MDE1945505.1 hypothetical protein [Patescibacteria group bacterium]MDE2057625.1 hypothetical protein [Patescibacteria group bacterium]
MARKTNTTPILKATHQGDHLGPLKIACAVLEDKERVVSIRSMALALGVKGGGAYWKKRKANPDADMLPEFISAKNIQPYVEERLPEIMAGTVEYTALNGAEAVGLKAEVIPLICDIWVKALLDHKLTRNQQKVAEQSRILLGAFATVGINALIDEATGYQKERDEYERLMARYIAKELQSWLKAFGEDYYYQIYRLKGWSWERYTKDKKNHPWAVANITNRIVYEKLPPGILEALDEMSERTATGNRRTRLHQGLTPEEGRTHLLKHLGAVVAMMEQFPDGDWDDALHAIDKRFPSRRIGPQLALSLKYQEADKNVFDAALSRAAQPETPELEAPQMQG